MVYRIDLIKPPTVCFPFEGLALAILSIVSKLSFGGLFVVTLVFSFNTHVRGLFKVARRHVRVPSLSIRRWRCDGGSVCPKKKNNPAPCSIGECRHSRRFYIQMTVTPSSVIFAMTKFPLELVDSDERGFLPKWAKNSFFLIQLGNSHLYSKCSK